MRMFFIITLCVCVCICLSVLFSLLSIVSQHCLLSSVLVILVARAMWLITKLRPNYTVASFLFKLKLCFLVRINRLLRTNTYSPCSCVTGIHYILVMDNLRLSLRLNQATRNLGSVTVQVMFETRSATA